MEKKHIMVVAILLILVAVVAFSFGKAVGMATKEAETAEVEEQTPAEETVTGETTEETVEVPGETGTTQEEAVEETTPEQVSEEPTTV